MQKEKMDNIFKSLEKAGYPPGLREVLLPEWVTSNVLADNKAAPEIAAILAKRLGLRASALFGENPSVELLRRRDTKYKRSVSKQSINLTAATSVAVSVAETVAAVCKVPFIPLENSAPILRKKILQIGGHWVGLRNLLMFCWSCGIPVVHLAELGDGVSKMDGMVVSTESRPVIILSKGAELWAWQLFILAHEVGHIALGHVAADEILVDIDLGEFSYALEDADNDERSADSFAIELLNGRGNATYSVSNSHANGREVADAAFNFGKAHQVDPGHIALNYAHQSKNWGVGVAAAKVLQGGNPPAAVIINQAMWGGIAEDILPLDTVEFLERITGSVKEQSI